MGLASLIFSGKDNSNYGRDITLAMHAHDINSDPLIENKLRVRKACQFYGMDELYVMGEVVSGCVTTNMKGSCNNKILFVAELECKYPGVTRAKKGMKIGLMVYGVEREDLREGDTITFC